MERALKETDRRREKQIAFNTKHNITPTTIKKDIKNTLKISSKSNPEKVDEKEIPQMIDKLRTMMSIASKSLDFETAIKLRDKIAELQTIQRRLKGGQKGSHKIKK